MSATYEVVVIGAGPGGMAAATVAAEAGLKVCLIDNNSTAGGQIWRGVRPDTAQKAVHGSSYARWNERLDRARCTVVCGSEVVAAPGAGALSLENEWGCHEVRYDRLILATGARERFLPFPGWTLPGVMGAGGMQALLKSGMKAGGKRVVVAGTGPLLLAVAAGATKAGARVISVHEQATLGKLAGFGLQVALSAPGKLLEGAAYRWQTRSAGFRLGSWVVRAEGGERLEQVVVTDGSHEERIACDWLACGFHLVPNLELPQLLGCRVEGGFVAVDEMQQSSVAGVACVGELTGVGGLEKALVEGEIAGWAAAGRTDKVRALGARRRAGVRFAARLESAFALRPELRGLADRTTVVCRCEDVTHGALAECKSGREARLHTRCGMGACQARVCGSATEFLYGWQPTSGRPPVFPARVETLLGASAER